MENHYDEMTRRESSLTFDRIFKIIKNYGWYQGFFLLTIQYACLSQASNMAGSYMSLGGLIPIYTCYDNNETKVYNKDNIGVDVAESCRYISNCANLTTDSMFFSMYQEFNWMCIPGHLLTTVASLTPFLSVISFIVSGHLADYFGRKWPSFIGLAINTFGGIACAFSPSWQFYLSLTVFNAATQPLFYGAAFALCMESVGSKWRLMQSFAFQWTFGYCFAGLVAYLTTNWRVYFFVVNILSLPVLVMFLFLEESPRWLVQKHRYKKAANVVNKIAKWNRGKQKDLPYTEEDMQMIEICTGAAKRRIYNIGHLFSQKKLILYCVAQISTGICINTVNSVILMNVQDLAGSPFLNIAFMGLLRIWTPFTVILMERCSYWFGRKSLLIGAQGTVFLCFSTMITIHMTGNWQHLHAIVTICALFGYAVEIGLVWVAYKTYTTELFPTVIRTIALNTFSLSSLVGSIIAPQFIFLRNYWHPMPYAGAALISLMSITNSWVILPETKGKSMPDTLEEIGGKAGTRIGRRRDSTIHFDSRASHNV